MYPFYYSRIFPYEYVVGVAHVAKEQTLCRRSGTRTREVAASDYILKLIDRVSPAADIDQRADYGPYHVAQEPVGADGEC